MKMSFDQMIEVITAAKQGKPIEHRDAFNDWRLCNPSVPSDFLFYGSNEYRVKPEPRKPREWRMCVLANGSIMQVPPNSSHHCIIVREVLE